jgi:ribosomal protein S18 acetylase RimI-like enzyme
MQSNIRPYHPSDLYMLYRICLLTGKSGQDASALYKDPELIGHFYAAPYAVLNPEVCFVLTCSDKPCGYIIGTTDSERFYRRCESEWFPLLRQRYPLPDSADDSADARIIRLMHLGHVVKPELTGYPAHLHIDLLPQAQGQGLGRNLIHIFIEKLKELGVPALHLEVGKSNPGAISFYERIGFEQIVEYEYSLAFGKRL